MQSIKPVLSRIVLLLIFIFSFNVSADVSTLTWTDTGNILTSTYVSPVKVTNCQAFWTCYTNSDQSVASGDVVFEFKVDGTVEDGFVGLSHSIPPSNPYYILISYGIYYNFASGGKFTINRYDNNKIGNFNIAPNGGNGDSFTANDVFKITVSGGTVILEKDTAGNGTFLLMHTYDTVSAPVVYPIDIKIVADTVSPSITMVSFTAAGPSAPTPPAPVDTGRLTNEDFQSEAQLITAGSSAVRLLNDTKIYVTATAKTMDDALADGDIVSLDATTCSENQYLQRVGSSWVCADAILANIGQAQFVGSLDYEDNNCSWSSTSFPFNYSIGSAACAPTITGNVTKPTVDATRGGVRVTNFRTDGYYRFTYNGLLYNGNNTGVCKFAWSKTSSYTGGGNIYLANSSNGGRENGQLIRDIKFESGDTGEAYIITEAQSGANCIYYGTTSDRGAISVHFFPDSNSLAAIQNTELCEVEAQANDGEAYTPISEDIPWKTTIKDNCNIWNNSGNTGNNTSDAIVPTRSAWYSLKFSADFDNAATGGWSLYKNGSKDKEGDTIINAGVNSIYSGSGLFYLEANQIYTIRTSIGNNLDNSAPTQNHYIHWKENAPKNAVITGTFEQIEEKTVTYTAENASMNSAFITGGGTPTILSDNYKMNDGTTPWISCTRPSTGNYNCTFASGLYTATPTCNISQNHPSTIQMGVNIESQSNTVLNFETFDGNTPFNVTAMNIVCVKNGADAIQDLKAVVINNLSSTKECQTKTLSANATTTGIVSDLTFNNLDLSKTYSLSSNIQIDDSADVAFNTFIFYEINGFTDGFNILNQLKTVDLMVLHNSPSKNLLTPNSSTVELNISLINGSVFIKSGSWIELCENGDNVVPTTKF